MDGGQKLNANPVVYTTSSTDGVHSDSLAETLSLEYLCAKYDDMSAPMDDYCRERAGSCSWQESPRNEDKEESFDAAEIFELIRHINDPEHPLTLEQLNVAQLENIQVQDNGKGDHKASSTVDVTFTPTIPHCSMATLIGLCINVKLIRSLPRRFKVRVTITPGTHATEDAVNKQLNDKERVAAALENGALLRVVNTCIGKSCSPPDSTEN